MIYTIIIPARLHSSRLPNKVLLDVAGKPLLQRVYEQVSKSRAKNIYIATDNDLIADCATSFGAQVIKTLDAENGTARLAQAVNILNLSDDEIIVNVQADVAKMPLEYIEQIATSLYNSKRASIATLVKKINNQEELLDRNIVKVVLNANNEALYFSRAALATSWHHIGVYAYRAKFLREYLSLPLCDLEISETLEQLRALYYGHTICVSEVMAKLPHDVNTQKDLDAAIKAYIAESVQLTVSSTP